MKTSKLFVLMAAIVAPNALATDLSIGAATTGDLNGFALKMGGDQFIGSVSYVVDDEPHSTLDLTTFTIGYKLELIDNLEVYPVVGGGFYTYHDTTGESYSESTFVYGGGVRYTVDQLIFDYSYQADKDSGMHTLSLGWEF